MMLFFFIKSSSSLIAYNDIKRIIDKNKLFQKAIQESLSTVDSLRNPHPIVLGGNKD